MNIRRLFLVSLLLSLFGMPLLAQEEMTEPDLRIGALPVVNMLPLYVALDGGYFDEAGIAVEIVDFPSGAAAQAAAVAGEIDGFQADLVSALKVNATGAGVHVVRHVGIADTPFIHIFAGRDSGITNIADLAGKRIGLSLNTIIQYMTDTLLASVGMSATDVEYVDVPGIWDRFQRLVDGNLDAATIVDPYNWFALAYDSAVLIDDTNVNYVPEALIIRTETLAGKGDVVRTFLQAYERAVETINAMDGDNAAYLEFLGMNDRGGGAVLKSTFNMGFARLPILTRARVPSEAEYRAVHDWALGAGLLAGAQAYADVVDGQYLPEVMEEDMAETADMAEEAAAPAAAEMREADLRFAVSPFIHSLPLHVAQDAGYFEEEGVVVEFVNFLNVVDLPAAVEAGEFDGLQFANMVGILRLNAGAGNLRVVREVAISNLPFFAISTGPESGIESMEDLTSTPLSLVAGTRAAVMIDEILTSAGLSADQVEIVYIDPTDVGNLLDQLLQGHIKVTLADLTFTQLVTMFGGTVLMDSDDVGYDGAQDMIGFRAQVLEEKGDAVRAFLRAYARAEETLNALEGNVQAYRQFVRSGGMEQGALVEAIVSSGVVPIFSQPGLPSAEDFASVQEWALAAGLLAAPIAYEDLVDGSFLMEAMAGE